MIIYLNESDDAEETKQLVEQQGRSFLVICNSKKVVPSMAPLRL